MSTLHSLERRVGEAKGADRALDAALACHFVFKDLRPSSPEDFDGKFGYRAGDVKTNTGFLMADRYTASVDAALALVERVLPPAWVRIDHWTADEYSGASAGITPRPTPNVTTGANAATPALAIILALLKALSAKGKGHE